MDKILFAACIVAILFALGKFAVAKFVYKEMPPVKVIVQDTVIAGIATLASLFGMSQLETVWSSAGILPGSVAAPPIFTDEPGF
jgi:hypothetical protein